MSLTRKSCIRILNPIITNLSSHTLSGDEYKTLKFGLNHGFTKQPRETDTFAIAEHCWEQLLDFNVFKDINHSLQRIRNLLRGFAFNYLNFATNRFLKSQSKL